jgi:hypothetical protein
MGSIQDALSRHLKEENLVDQWQFDREQLVVFEGRRYTFRQLAVALSNSRIGIGSTDINFLVESSIQAAPSSIDFSNEDALLAQAYLNAKQSGALNVPAVKKLIDYFTANIFQISELFEHYGNDGINPLYPSSMASLLTHLNSAGICETGGGKDSGVQCQ